MATLGNALVNKILGHSAAEKAFRPWWDNMEDFLVYGLVMLGLIVAPTAIINGTPLDCTPCVRDHCQGKFEDDDVNLSSSSSNRSRQIAREEALEDPKFNSLWVKKFCTMTAVDQFILYFPYILLIMALVIVMIERVFIRIFKSGLKLDMFYNLLVKETLEDESGAKLIITGGGLGGGGAGADRVDGVGSGGGTASSSGGAPVYQDLENSRIAIEVSQTFQQSSNYFLSYFLRTSLELTLASLLLVWLLFMGLPSIQKDEFIYCSVHGFFYECAGHPQQFYMYVLFITIAILLLYLLCNVYNLLWLLFPQLGTLSSVMRKYRLETRRKFQQSQQDDNNKHLSDPEMLGELYNIYYNNRDLKLLLDLLAESSGIAPSLRIMSLFDPGFRAMCEPTDLKVVKVGKDSLEVEFGDSRTMREIFGRIQQVVCIYTVEILPATNRSSVLAFKQEREKGGGGEYLRKVRKAINADGDTELQNLNTSDGSEGGVNPASSASHSGGKHHNRHKKQWPPKKAHFRELDPMKEYTVRVSTIVNGRAIARRTEAVKPGSQFE